MGEAATATIAFLVLALLLPFVLVYALQTPSLRWNPSSFLYLAVSIYSGARLAMTCRSGPPQYMAVAFFGFTYVWMGLAAVAQSFSQSLSLVWPAGFSFDQSLQLQSAVIVLLGIITYDVGRLLTCTRRKGVLGDSPTRARRLSMTRVRLLGWIVLFASPAAIILLGGLYYLSLIARRHRTQSSNPGTSMV